MADGSGWYDEYMHLSSFAVKDGARVKQGDVIGHSGASGSGSFHYYAPHLHLHRYDPQGNRVNAWHYFGGEGHKFTNQHHNGVSYTLNTGHENESYRRALLYFAREGGYKYGISDFVSVSGWRGIMKMLGKDWGYTGPDDGFPGQHTFMALQRLAHQHGSKDPIDGILSDNDRKAISRFLNTLR
jgi:hypothetical protein